MSAGEGIARPRQRLAELEEAASNDPNEKQRVYYAMLAARLESLLDEIEESGPAKDDELVVRLRALHAEVAPKAKVKSNRA
jgi:hypothetical protein